MEKNSLDGTNIPKNIITLDDTLFPNTLTKRPDYIFNQLLFRKDAAYSDNRWIGNLAREAALHEAKRPKEITFVAGENVTESDTVYFMEVIRRGLISYFTRYSRARNSLIAQFSKKGMGAVAYLNPGLEEPHIGELVEIHSSDRIELATKVMFELRRKYGFGRDLKIAFEGDFSDADKCTINAIMSLYTTSEKH